MLPVAPVTMAVEKKEKFIERPWMTVFMEAAVRAIRVVHHAHQPLTLGKPGQDGQGERLDGLNVGRGIELADERVVCGQILLELATSRITSNIHFIANEAANIRVGRRTFEYDHEAHVGDRYVDLVFKREDEERHEQQHDEKKHRARKFGRIYIQAKRARRWKIEPLTGNASPGLPLVDEIRDDVKKLKEVRDHLGDEEAYFYVLVWGSTMDQRTPAGMLDGIPEHGAPRRAFRWLPLCWGAGDWDKSPDVTAWLWVALLEVLPGRTAPSG